MESQRSISPSQEFGSTDNVDLGYFGSGLVTIVVSSFEGSKKVPTRASAWCPPHPAACLSPPASTGER